ncbi:hypothetical protein DVA80_21200, partial [Acinetobacter baumannii]|uniref:hypothetical protein n=1 Tax=Acinetobacter baumannii TaxID=470 RepID=UPI000E004B06
SARKKIFFCGFFCDKEKAQIRENYNIYLKKFKQKKKKNKKKNFGGKKIIILFKKKICNN